nr:low molecular weight phosphatase family protein [Kibdelosporangium sp. MJ126-NF4]CEL17844.1 Low molecular weight protein-tyrosine-phosphatase Wzb [Kibdelosporangium sp. MJ126-NF4]CTQ90932.1 Low molecular weight protein-tyrosine-phosphatase Wzb (EC 3.1.3.48) [Kibdelosporangium sp. MJ126-NF4]
MSKNPWWLAGGMLGLACGYFFWYTPYAALTKVLSADIGRFELLSSAALGTLAGAALFLGSTGWWRRIRVDRSMLTAGFFMSLIIATTTLNYTFAGVSILFMLLMMRGGILILSPVVDAVRHRRVNAYSWAALGFSLLAVVAALSDVSSYVLTGGAVLSLAVYYTGYVGRFGIMSKVAKTGDADVDRGYLASEMAIAAVFQVVMVSVFGFGSFTFGGFVVGLLYAALYVYGTLIYLDRREYTWCVPANRCASLLSGLVASFGLTLLTGIAAPGTGQLIAAGLVFMAIAALSYPAVVRGPVILFVCGGNTCRSAMAEVFARTASGRRRVVSAGLSAKPGSPMSPETVVALRELGISPNGHAARQLTPGMIARADRIYVMTDEQRAGILAIAPRADVSLVDPSGDIPDPHGHDQDAFGDCAVRIRDAVSARLVPA